jgi:hypothetical protein
MSIASIREREGNAVRRLVALAALAGLAALAACSDDPLPYFNPNDIVATDTGADTGGRDPGTPNDPGRDPGTPIDPGTDPGTDPGKDPGTPADPGTPTDPGGGDDVSECVDSSGCALGHICVDRRCVPGCLSDRDCATDRFCDRTMGANGTCVQCLNQSHCGEGEKCVAGTCLFTCLEAADCVDRPATPYCNPDTGLCVACTTDGQCQIGTLCVGNACVSGCRSDRDCQSPLKCDRTVGDNGACVPCVVDTDCPENQVCTKNVCGIDCARIQCPVDRPVCLPATGACVQCDDKADCGVGKLCVNNVCIAGCESDDDCASPLHCKTGAGGGTCVQCVLDGHCPVNQVCRSNTCSTGGCVKDTDCGAGKYCHPLLRSCEALPSGYCASDQDCVGILPFLTQYCDPLTRKCVDGCKDLPFCLDLLGSGRTVCKDGLCYGCGSDYDCPGTRCDPFDRFCLSCATSADCAYPGWVCQASSGNCYECLSSFDCGAGKVCDTANKKCVQCLSSGDCKDPSKPVCGKSGTCLAPCNDECTSGKRRCNPNDTTAPISYQDCGDSDDDPCTEWGMAYECGLASTCATQTDGSGKCVCANECASGDKQCKVGETGRRYYCAQSSATGCWYWTSSSCSYGEICSGGECVCDHECSEGQRACDSQDADIYYTCVQDYYTYCWMWQTNYCASGKQCVQGYCQ